jgi:hypothetical protein
MVGFIPSTFLVLNIVYLAHQAFCFPQLLLQEAYTFSQLFLAWQYLSPPNPSGNSTPDTSRQRESLYLLLAYFESLYIFFLFLLASFAQLGLVTQSQ